MNVAPDETIILGLQIFLDHRSLNSMGQKILMILHPPSPPPFFDLSSSMEVISMNFECPPSSFAPLLYCQQKLAFLASNHFLSASSRLSFLLSYNISLLVTHSPTSALFSCLIWWWQGDHLIIILLSLKLRWWSSFLAVQDSSIGDLVTHSLSQ